jgi:hypothetical protein
MLKIRKHLYRYESKSELTASKILNRISNREEFDVSEYFRPKKELMNKRPRMMPAIEMKRKRLDFYSSWDIANSMRCSRGFRSRHREVIDKLKLKFIETKAVDFQITPELKNKVDNSPNIIKFR